MTQSDFVIQVVPGAEWILWFNMSTDTSAAAGEPGLLFKTNSSAYTFPASELHPEGSLPGVLGSVCHSETPPGPAQMARAGLSPSSLPQEERGQTALSTSSCGYK